MRHITTVIALLVFCIATTCSYLPSLAATPYCSEDDIAALVDNAGKQLREINAGNADKFRVRLAELGRIKGWAREDVPERVQHLLRDQKIIRFEEREEALLTKLDRVSTQSSDDIEGCPRLVQLKAHVAELLAVADARSAYVLARLDDILEQNRTSTAKAVPQQQLSQQPKPLSKSKETSSPSIATRKKKLSPADSWSTTATVEPSEPDAQVAVLPQGDQNVSVPESGQTYSIREIQDAGRGFFGTISANLASMIEYVFQQTGGPNGYILGQEGGGAFLAGLRYGKGKLHTKSSPPQRIFWQGPSIGYDFGADGARTMILVYNLDDTSAALGRFTGVSGSAYLIGGIGVTFLQRGKVVMAPIRTGLGLRIGASIGYLKFTPRRTFNPF